MKYVSDQQNYGVTDYWNSPYELVMVDEFQDASQARARLAKALVEDKDACLFAVGDDWQSINRFAGADLSDWTIRPALRPVPS